MLIKVATATNNQLDWLVAKCEGGYDLRLVSTYGAKKAWQYTMMDDEDPERMDRFYLADTSYSTDPVLSYPIIDREKIDVAFTEDGWYANMYNRMTDSTEGYTGDAYRCGGDGPTPLIAAMRCFVTSRLGDEVEVPDEIA